MSSDIIKSKLKNGVTVYVVPKKGYMEKQAMVAFNYGSSDNMFLVEGDKRDYPQGIAHFLEHKLFEEKDKNIFDEFSRLGASTNAFTNFNTTAYYFNTVDNFKECFDILLGFVSNLYLTEENVKKEKDIITQEIRMYEDDAMWQVYFNLLCALYKEHPIRNNIAGSVESVESITKAMLEDCYSSFYTMDNVAVIVAGDVDNDEVIAEVNSKLKLCESKEIKRYCEAETSDIYKHKISSEMSIKRAIFNIGFKENQIELSMPDRAISSKMVLDIMFGTGSRLYERLYSEGLIDDSFSYDYLSGKDYGVSIISGVTSEVEEVKNAILKEIECFKQKGLQQVDVDRIRKKQIGRLKRAEQSVSGICSIIADNFCKGIEMVDFYKKYDNIDIGMLKNRIDLHFDVNNMAISVIEPK